MKNKNDAFILTIDKLNNIDNLESSFNYYYDSDYDWYTITHNVEHEIQTDDDIAKTITDILVEYLVDKDIYNFSFEEELYTQHI